MEYALPHTAITIIPIAKSFSIGEFASDIIHRP